MPIKAVQQFQIRSVINTESDARATLEAMKTAGYDGIELCGFLISPMPLAIRLLTKAAGMPIGKSGKLDWHTLMRDSGLKAVSLHEDLNGILKNPALIADKAGGFDTKNIVITGMRKFDYGDREAVLQLCENLNKAGRLLKESGLALHYHNHNCELQKIGGQTAFQLILQNTDPAVVFFEYDSYWPAEAGCDPLQLMHQIGSRMRLYHINDRGFRASGAAQSIRTSDSMELGDGNMDLVPLVEAAKDYGVEAIILESHKNWLNNSPVDSFKRSAAFINQYV